MSCKVCFEFDVTTRFLRVGYSHNIGSDLWYFCKVEVCLWLGIENGLQVSIVGMQQLLLDHRLEGFHRGCRSFHPPPTTRQSSRAGVPSSYVQFFLSYSVFKVAHSRFAPQVQWVSLKCASSFKTWRVIECVTSRSRLLALASGVGTH
jgi:hypothetical protein